ncbi:hypothetical protein GX50_07107 [[Emmonsia] crescens]|uniref:Uncharacterized protein n=1 Tax=[Emmonsia] crescens TaxID=73230 RepID=A0A2B7Z9R9_9EURO|nr:hypothetical protein GX50_07107 [Emmonsia crescens]
MTRIPRMILFPCTYSASPKLKFGFPYDGGALILRRPQDQHLPVLTIVISTYLPTEYLTTRQHESIDRELIRDRNQGRELELLDTSLWTLTSATKGAFRKVNGFLSLAQLNGFDLADSR